MPIYLKDIFKTTDLEELLSLKFKGAPSVGLRSKATFQIVGLPFVEGLQHIKVKTSYEANYLPHHLVTIFGDCEVVQEEGEYGIDSKPLNLLSALHKFGLLNTGIVRQIGHEFNFDAFEYCHQEGITYNVD